MHLVESESGRRTGGEGLDAMMGDNTDESQGAYVECSKRVRWETVSVNTRNPKTARRARRTKKRSLGRKGNLHLSDKIYKISQRKKLQNRTRREQLYER